MDNTLLHFIWEHEYFDEHELCSQNGQPIEIIHPGKRNPGTGPDFIKARIKVGDTIRIGSVVINMDGADLYKKDLFKDPDYSNIALHVAYRNIPSSNNKSQIPILELNGKVSESFREIFSRFRTSSAIIACADHLKTMQPRIVRSWQEQLLTEAIESSILEIESLLEFHDWDWDRAFMHLLISNFDENVNKEAFQAFSDILDYTLLMSNQKNLLHVEAILFGQSGMLNSSSDDEYICKLKGVFESLTEGTATEILNPDFWITNELIDNQKPAVKIAQLAALIHQYTPMFSSFQEQISPSDMLMSVTASDYWKTHSRIGKLVPEFSTGITKKFSSQLIISTFIPVLFAFGKSTSVPEIMVQAIELLKYLEPQKNRKTDMLNTLGVPCWNAADSLALVYAVDKYCLQQRCLSCPLGCSILGIKKGPRVQKELKRHSYIYN